MNNKSHTHPLIYSPEAGGRIDYGGLHVYLHLMTNYNPPSWWPRWYLIWKTKRVITQLIKAHDETTRRVPPVTKTEMVRALIAEANEAIEGREWGSQPREK